MTAAAYVNGAWQCYDLRDGRTKHFLGCRHLLPKSAIEHTPLRAFDEATTPVPVPPSGAGSMVASSEPPRGSQPAVAAARAVIPPPASSESVR